MDSNGGLIEGLVIGGLIAWILTRHHRHRRKPLDLLADDNCQSLFYGGNIGVGGVGLPQEQEGYSEQEMERMKTIRSAYVRLPTALYRDVVWNLPTVCVDVVLCNSRDNTILLFFRKDKPAANIWWLPGGRMLKGETFYQAALRKISEETGNLEAREIVARDILTVWNTFFSDSSWDEGRPSEEHGCQTVNITVFCEIPDEIGAAAFTINEEVSRKSWAVQAHKWVSVDEVLKLGNYDKYVRLNVELARAKGLL